MLYPVPNASNYNNITHSFLSIPLKILNNIIFNPIVIPLDFMHLFCVNYIITCIFSSYVTSACYSCLAFDYALMLLVLRPKIWMDMSRAIYMFFPGFSPCFWLKFGRNVHVSVYGIGVTCLHSMDTHWWSLNVQVRFFFSKCVLRHTST